MLIRALIVLLLMLNLGVAAWWTWRVPPAPPAPVEEALGVARLQLLSEAQPKTRAAATTAPVDAAVAAVGAAPTAPAAPAEPVATQCASFGPFATAAVAAAQVKLQAVTQRVVTRQQPATSSRGWRVYLPPFASAEDAEAAAQRIAAAGFSDYFVVREGGEVNSIALGRYGGESSARTRADALVAAGFPARAEAIGGAAASHWLDVVAAAGFDAARAQALASAPQHRVIDCATIK